MKLVAQTVKNLPSIQETQVRSLGRKDPLEKEIATHSSILAWRIPWTRAWWALVHGVAKLDTTEQLTLSLFLGGGSFWSMFMFIAVACWLLDIFICSHNTAFFRYAEDKIASAEAQTVWAP